MKPNEPDIKTVDEYIALFPEPAQHRMAELRTLIKKVLPTSIENISYRMPSYRMKPGKRPLVYFGCFENHIGVYALHGTVDEKLQKELGPFVTGKGTLQFPHDQPMPLDVIEKLLIEKRTELGL